MTIKAALDIGSNSSKLLVLEMTDTGYTILWDESRVTGMGKGVGASGELAPEALERTFATVSAFAERARAMGAESIRAAGTAALRSAGNREEFIGRVQKELGITVEVLSGADEARLARLVALKELTCAAGQAVAFFDTGGGSTEVTLCHGERVVGEVSLPLGARRCTEAAQLSHPVTPQARERLEAMITTTLADVPAIPDDVRPGAVQLAGLGGTATNVVWMLQGARGEGISDPHLKRVARGELRGLLDLLAPMMLREVQVRPNLDPARAEVMFAGIAIIKGLLDRYGADYFTLVDRGLRWGLLFS